MRTSIAILLVCFATSSVADAVDRHIAATMARLHIPGLSLAVLRHGRTLKAKSYGFADLELRVPLTNRSAFMIGSVSKQFESAGLLSLAERGLISLDDPITKYLYGLPGGWAAITIRNLMTHTSGLKDYTDLPEHESAQGEPIKSGDMLRLVQRYPLEFDAGTKWSYSNTGSYLEGLIIQKVTGMSYEAFARKHLWQPARMTATRINRWADVVPNRVHGYVWHNGSQHHPDFQDDSWPWAGGGCLSSLDDLIAWTKALESGLVISRNRLKEMWSPVNLKEAGTYPFGLDWFLSDLRGYPRMYRTGHIGGFSAVIVRYPGADLDVIVLCNEDDINTPRLAAEIAGIFEPDLAPEPTSPMRVDPDPTKTKHVQQGIAGLAAGVLSSRWLTPGLIASTTDRLRGELAAALKAHATLRFICADDLRRRSIDRLGTRVVEVRHYRIGFAGRAFVEGIYLDAKGRVAFLLDE